MTVYRTLCFLKYKAEKNTVQAWNGREMNYTVDKYDIMLAVEVLLRVSSSYRLSLSSILSSFSPSLLGAIFEVNTDIKAILAF